MAWLDDRIQTHPKTVGLSDRAFRAWINGLCYCSMHGTGGQLDAAIRVHRLPKTIVRELVRSGLWDEEDDGTIWVHDWQAHNESRDTALEQRRAADRERQRAHRERVRASRDTDGGERHVTTGRVSRDASRDSERDSLRGRAPVPTRASAHAPARSRQDHDQEPGPPSSSKDVDDDLLNQLQALKPSRDQLERWSHAAGHDPERIRACLRAASSRGRNQAAYLDTLIANGSSPLDDREPTVSDLPAAWSKFVNGHGWDDTYDQQMILDELARRRERHPGTLDEQAALAQWKAERERRYGTDEPEPRVTPSAEGATVP